MLDTGVHGTRNTATGNQTAGKHRKHSKLDPCHLEPGILDFSYKCTRAIQSDIRYGVSLDILFLLIAEWLPNAFSNFCGESVSLERRKLPKKRFCLPCQ